MSTRIRFTPDPARMVGTLTNAPEFPGEAFTLNLPEAIGDASRVSLTHSAPPDWTPLGGGAWRTHGFVPAELAFLLTLSTGRDWVEIRIDLTNLSQRVWSQSLAFTCFACFESPSIADFDCARHWARVDREHRRLIELPRCYGPRPTVQAYSILGAPPATQIPFATGFHATPDVTLENWLAIRSRDGNRLAAVASSPALFLFQNMEYSCIHSCPSFGALSPGQTGQAVTRVYLARATLQDWYRRMKAELHGG